MTEVPFEVTVSFPNTSQDSAAVIVRGTAQNYRIAVLDVAGTTLAYVEGTERFSLSAVEALARHVADTLDVDYLGFEKEADNEC